jgi:predicted protein tyrosine phosphatase
MIHVCSLSRLHTTVEDTGARHVVTLINAGTPVPRPVQVAADDHLFLGMNDIVQPLEGYVAPGESHVRDLLAFVTRWPREAPLVVHCWAGISRSTAAAFISTCALDPARDEHALAHQIRALSPEATPNIRLVMLADRMMGRNGRMVSAIESIGRGVEAAEGTPFRLDLR